MKRFLASVLLAAALTVTPVLAQEAAKSAEHSSEAAEKGGEKPGLEIWKWLNFAILAGVLGYLISKNLGPVLVDRSKQIAEGLAAGERAKAEADARAAAVQAKLAGLGDAVAALKASARDERERESARIERDTRNELARIQAHEAQEIESADKLARLRVQREAARLAIELAEQKVRARMSDDTQAVLLSNFLGDLTRESAKPRTT